MVSPCRDDVAIDDTDGLVYDQRLERPACLLAPEPTGLHQVENVCLRDGRVSGVSVDDLCNGRSWGDSCGVVLWVVHTGTVCRGGIVTRKLHFGSHTVPR